MDIKKAELWVNVLDRSKNRLWKFCI